MEVRRSVLFMAINNPRFLRGAARHNCDGVILDLEDAVAEPHKAYARTLPREAYPEVSRGGATVQIRINHMYWEADLEGAVWPGLSVINYPKTEYAEEIRRLDKKISELERLRGIRPGTIEIHAAVETVRGVTNGYEIATSSPRVRTFGGGGMGFDNCRDLAIETLPGVWRAPEHYGIGETGLIARALGLHCTNGVRQGTGVTGNVISGDTALDEAAANRRAGLYAGITCLHPNRVDGINQGYTPTPEEVQQAREVLARFEELDGQGEVAGDLKGQPVDKWEAARARKLLAWSEACARREREKSAARARLSAAGNPSS
jgi:citrate lyase subunit beta / citryl-CoA lyase